MENSSATTPDSDTGEEEGDVMSHSKSTYQNISMPQTAANGKKDNAQQMAEVHRLTPA